MTDTTLLEQPTLVSASFELRPLTPADAGLIALYAGDLRVASRTSRIAHPLPPGEPEAFIQRALASVRNEDVWAIDASKDRGPSLAGIISLKKMDRNQSEIGYWVAPAFWNTGVASGAVQCLLAANPQGCETIFASVFQDNPASARVLTNQGFEYIGDAETFSVARNTTVPTWTYIYKLT